MKNIIVISIFIGLSVCSCHVAAPADISGAVSEAFEKAGLPLLNKKQTPADFNLDILNVNAESTQFDETVQLSNLKGNIVFLNFWATWCPPCRAEMPSMQALYERFGDKGLQFAAVDIMEKEDDIIKFLDSYKLSFPILLDTYGNAANKYGINAIPATFIIGRDGNIIARVAGARKWDTPEMIKAFEALLAAN
jgi:thiol-disulfide isomerase/thioredoxin